jgi:8-oxo-dGTP pyrophosphatase MutT (NUDIX family)
MQIILSLKDDQYPFSGVKEVREISRAILSDGKGHYAVHHVVRNDVFGNYQYFETPGGGIDPGESAETACIRECYEETGYRVKIVAELGEVVDYYNLLKRENHNHYYLCERDPDFLGTHFVSAGDAYIKETLWLTIPEIIDLYESTIQEKIPLLCSRRELPIWKKALSLTQAKKR